MGEDEDRVVIRKEIVRFGGKEGEGEKEKLMKWWRWILRLDG